MLNTACPNPKAGCVMKLSACASFALGLLGACGNEDAAREVAAVEPTITGVKDAWLAGVLRDVPLAGPLDGPLDGRVDHVELHAGGDALIVNAVVEQPGRALMLQATFAQARALLETDGTASFSSEQADELRLLGCIGQAVGVWDVYDLPADTVDVTVDVTVDPTDDSSGTLTHGMPAARARDGGDVIVVLEGAWRVDGAAPPATRTASLGFTLTRER